MVTQVPDGKEAANCGGLFWFRSHDREPSLPSPPFGTHIISTAFSGLADCDLGAGFPRLLADNDLRLRRIDVLLLDDPADIAIAGIGC